MTTRRAWSRTRRHERLRAVAIGMAHVPPDHDFTRGVPLTEDGRTYPIGVLMQTTPIWNFLTWCPVVSASIGLSPEGVPIGIQFISKPHDTETVFHAASAYSKGGPKLFTGDLFPDED